MEVGSSFKYLESFFNKIGGPQEDLQLKVDEGLKAFDTMETMFNVRSISLDVEGLVWRVVVPTVTYGAETCSMRMDDGHKLDVWKWGVYRDVWSDSDE